MAFQENRRDQRYLDPEFGISLTIDSQLRDKVDYKIVNVIAMGKIKVVDDSIDLNKIEVILPVTLPKYNGQRGTFLISGNSKIIGLGFNSLTHLETTIRTFVQKHHAKGLV